MRAVQVWVLHYMCVQSVTHVWEGALHVPHPKVEHEGEGSGEWTGEKRKTKKEWTGVRLEGGGNVCVR